MIRETQGSSYRRGRIEVFQVKIVCFLLSWKRFIVFSGRTFCGEEWPTSHDSQTTKTKTNTSWTKKRVFDGAPTHVTNFPKYFFIMRLWSSILGNRLWLSRQARPREAHLYKISDRAEPTYALIAMALLSSFIGLNDTFCDISQKENNEKVTFPS